MLFEYQTTLWTLKHTFGVFDFEEELTSWLGVLKLFRASLRACVNETALPLSVKSATFCLKMSPTVLNPDPELARACRAWGCYNLPWLHSSQIEGLLGKGECSSHSHSKLEQVSTAWPAITRETETMEIERRRQRKQKVNEFNVWASTFIVKAW